jgi:hypothetical protein
LLFLSALPDAHNAKVRPGVPGQPPSGERVDVDAYVNLQQVRSARQYPLISGAIHNTEQFFGGWYAGGIKFSNTLRFVFDNYQVHHNHWYGVWTILARDPSSGANLGLDWRKAYAGGNLYNSAAGNRGYDNRYWYGSTEGSRQRFCWLGGITRLGAFNLTLGEERGRYLSDAEKQQVVSAKGIPAFPEPY